MRIALCQTNQTLGDFPGNRDRILAAAKEAASQGADLAVFPELAVTGYPPLDLLHLSSFVAAAERTVEELARALPTRLAVVAGTVLRNTEAAARGGRPLSNGAVLLQGGEVLPAARKCLLPTYDVFDEHRYFEPFLRPELGVHEIGGVRVGITICEDVWNDKTFWERRLYTTDPVEEQVRAGARVLVNLSASPWCKGKERERHRMLLSAARRHGVRIVMVNLVGGQVELLFDGSSTAVGPDGAAFAPVAFRETMAVADTEAPWTVQPPELEELDTLRSALAMGIADYFRKYGFQRAVVGLSGGIDSALVAALAAEALGPEQVTGLAMPSPYSSEHSLADARRLAENLGIAFHVVPIHEVFAAFRAALGTHFAGRAEDVAEENLQSRIRGTLLMAWSNKFGHLVLTTGNKSEAAVGYTTLYGDTCGGLAAIADLWKQEVYALARHINRDREVIPGSSLTKPPSAELRPGQLDTDTLPPYERLDPILRQLVEEEASVEEAAARTGEPPELVRSVRDMLHRSEYKRFQFPPALRVSRKAWVGRVYPLLHRFRE